METVQANGGGFLGSVVLFAVGFVAQNTFLDLVDDGRQNSFGRTCVKDGS